MQTLTILGATGSIGKSTLDVVARHPERFRIAALTARNQVDAMEAACLSAGPRYAVMSEAAAAAELDQRLRARAPHVQVLAGEAALSEVAALPEVDTVMAAIVGAAGLRPTLAAARAGKRVLLANKEALVMAGQLFLRTVREGGGTVIPIDSEHNAILQCLPGRFDGNWAGVGVRRILLTASGGPFRATPFGELAAVTPDQACAHPNWVMGRKISVDSATMMNKGLEVIEAHYLFNAPAESIEVVVHPQSVIHSMVEYVDGSVIAQMGNPDMRTPIAHALAFPERIESGVRSLNFFALTGLHFERPDLARFPCLALAYDALRMGGTMPATLNAANEVAVARFLEGGLRFDRIAPVIETVLARAQHRVASGLDDVFDADRCARDAAKHALAHA
ncbi:MAG: 1-deoxy-D-xylulose-5-phosphate reductoisomerase [Burkholderiales bacterium]|nr:1-deoxy-D-xylulose-5-phosphate reductoisomerase [Burkholderiales bacterium]